MIAGVQPFKALTSYLSMEKTKKAEYTFPPGFDTTAQDLVVNLLTVDPTQRLGDAARGGPAEIRTHRFFEGVDWEGLWTRVEAPPLEPGLVKKEPPPPPKGRSRSKPARRNRARSYSRTPAIGTPNGVPNGPYVDDDDDDAAGGDDGDDGEIDDSESNSDDAFDYDHDDDGGSSDRGFDSDTQEESPSGTGNRRGEAWAALVRDLSEGEMDDGRPRASLPHGDDGVESDEGTVNGADDPERQRGRSQGLSSSTPPLLSDDLVHSYSTTTGGNVIVWDAHYGGTGRAQAQAQSQSTSSQGVDPGKSAAAAARARISEEINLVRVNGGGGGSPDSSTATSSTGESEKQGAWYANLSFSSLHSIELLTGNYIVLS